MKIALAVLTTALLLSLLVGCGSKEPAGTAASAPPLSVHALTVEPAAWSNIYEATGTVRARTSAVLSSQVMGYVREVRVSAGDHVREGQLLVVLDSRDLDAGYRQAEAARAEARDAVPEADNAVAGAKANLDLAKATYRRMKELFDKDSISNQEFDETTARLKVAQSSYEMALAKRTQLESRIAQASQALASAEVMRSYAQITAPFAGTVTAKSVDPGILATPGVPLLTIEHDGSYRLEASVEESKLPLIRIGQPVTVSLDALGRPVEGRVSEIVPAIDSASRSFTVKIDLPAVAQLRSGLFGRARFALGTRQVLAIPAAAVTERGQLSSVFVTDGSHARSRFVTLGQRSQDTVEILSGLNPGERVIFPVPEGLGDGAPVEVRP
jgi:multidrug efflux system membrane fusion protein